jgi:hypothetical protein
VLSRSWEWLLDWREMGRWRMLSWLSNSLRDWVWEKYSEYCVCCWERKSQIVQEVGVLKVVSRNTLILESSERDKICTNTQLWFFL